MSQFSTTSVTDLRCETATTPLGTDVAAPRLSWRMSTDRRGARQTSYRVTVGRAEGAADLWDTGKIESDQSIHVVYGGTPLQSRERAYWQVTVRDEVGHDATSEISWWETGLMSAEDWTADWIQ